MTKNQNKTEIKKERKPPLIKRLRAGIKGWDEFCGPMLTCRNRMLRHYANFWYNGGVGAGAQPLNLIDRAITILGPFLVSNNPKALVKAKRGAGNPNAKWFAEELKWALNALTEEIKLADYTLRPVTIDAFFGMGITVCGRMHSHTVELGGYLHDYGQPFCDKVDMADYIGDRAARNRQEMHFEGYRYRLPIQYVAESGLFKNYDLLVPNLRLYGQGTHPEEISKGNKLQKSNEEIYPTVELANVWLPDSNVIVTMPAEGQGDRYLREVEWDGPETGPMDVLGFKYFPDTVVPIPPAYNWMDINKVINIVVNKMKDMVEREKTIAVGGLDNPEDKQLVQNSKHGDFILLKGGAETIKEVTYGGFNPQSFPFLQFLLGEFSRLGPNLNLTGGREALAGTLGQEQMLQTNALREIDDMVTQIYNFSQSVMLKLSHFLTTDVLKTNNFSQDFQGITQQRTYYSNKIEGVLSDYDVRIEPYSLSRMNPEVRYQRMLQLISQIVIPLTPLAMQQGSYPIVDNIVKEAGEYLHIDTDNWWKSAAPAGVQMGRNQPNAAGQMPKSGQSNVGVLGRADSSKQANLQQQQTRTGGGT